MGDNHPRVRLRQAVLVASDLEAVAAQLRSALALDEPFRDPGVSEFGLSNVVFALGDCFLEVISPSQPDTAAGRWLARHGGDGGYMALFDLQDLEGARDRVAQSGIRVVWQIDLPDISGTHLHPADMHGAIVSLDRSDPYGSWRWGGPQWTARTGTGAPGHLAGITVAVSDPAATAERWAHVLGVPLKAGAEPRLTLDGGEVGFVQAKNEAGEGLTAIAIESSPALDRAGGAVEVGGVRLVSPVAA